MTFSQQTKQEIEKIFTRQASACCVDAFLYGVFKSIGSIVYTSRGVGIAISSENLSLLELCKSLVKNKFDIYGDIQEESTLNMRNSVLYSATFDRQILEKLKLVQVDSSGEILTIEKNFVQSDCCKRAFLQGLFVATGSVVVPLVSDDLTVASQTKRYHLEFAFTNSALGKDVKEILSDCGFDFKETSRKQVYVLYIKNSETIADFLVFLGATKAKLQLENLLVERSIRNNANRTSNCISANIDKAIEAGQKQLLAIDKLQKNGILQTLPKPLIEVATERIENPDLSLNELAENLGLSKSGVRHRLNKLIELAKELEEQEKK